ncbi:hypothetical protein EJB05_10449, partial [Eragrostis curvula]
MAGTMRALLIVLPPVSVLLVIAARSLARMTARNLGALARAQFACLPAGGGSSSFRQLSAASRKLGASGELPVAPYRRSCGGGGEEEEECVVCLSGIEEGEEVRELKCRHLFHRSCLDRWLLARPAAAATCPLCRCQLLQAAEEADLAEEEEEEEEEDSDVMLFMACVHGRSSWFWPSS